MLLKGSLRERVKRARRSGTTTPAALGQRTHKSLSMLVNFTTNATLEKDQSFGQHRCRTMSTAAPSEAAVDYKNSTFVLRYTLEEVRKRWVAYAKAPVARGGLGKGVNYTVSRSWFGKQRPSNVRLNPELNGSKMWVRKAQKQRGAKSQDAAKATSASSAPASSAPASSAPPGSAHGDKGATAPLNGSTSVGVVSVPKVVSTPQACDSAVTAQTTN